jgi:hypothetical protein
MWPSIILHINEVLPYEWGKWYNITGSKMFVICRCAFKLCPSKTTSSVATSNDIPIHTIIDPPPKLSLVTKLHCAYCLPGRLYTITCLSDLYRQNLDLSKTKTLRQSCATQSTCSNAKFKQGSRPSEGLQLTWVQ